jgi:excisionase family DNA binding protein
MRDNTTLPDPQIEPTISVERAAQLLGICRVSGYEAAKNGDLPVIRIGRRVLVPTAALLRMLGADESDPATARTRTRTNPA